jgi:hypothetical protein
MRIRLLIAPMMILLLAVLQAPTQAQALFLDFLPFSIGTSEPVALLLTGLALLTLARIGVTSSRTDAADDTTLARRPAALRRARPAARTRSTRRAA